jgi:hypothetical protein
MPSAIAERRGLTRIDQAITSLREQATQHSRRFENARRLNLRKFPYAVWYEAKQNSVEVFAVLHHARDPRFVRDRHEADR